MLRLVASVLERAGALDYATKPPLLGSAAEAQRPEVQSPAGVVGPLHFCEVR